MKVGLIGINSPRNENHFLKVKEALGNNLYCIFSPHTEDILPISKTYNVKLFTSANDLFEKSDAVYFANSLKPNYDFALNALKKSCYLFIEDISMLSIDEIKYLYKVASEARIKIQLKLTKSFLPEYLIVKNNLIEPKLIEINDSYTYLLRNEEYFNTILNNLFLADQFINSGVKKISTLALPLDKNHFGLVNIRIDYDNGTIVNIKTENIVSEIKNTVSFYQPEQVINVDFKQHFAVEHKFDMGHISRNEFDINQDNALHTEIDNFIHSCQNFNPQNISESPKIVKIIKTTFDIIEQLSQTNNHL